MMRLRVATVAGAVGLRGHVRLIIHTDQPAERLYVGARLLTDEGELEIADVRAAGRGYQVAFVGHEDRTSAEALRDRQLYIDSQSEDESDDEFFYHDLIGLPARDLQGHHLGQISGVLAMPAHDVIEVRTDHGTVLVPFVSEIIPHIDSTEVRIDPPGGLFS
ncbi:MAG: ribosome maturation factor RimM [Bowdeniella nasicola]|nr:ribosome maturation factor RimM [Bowdeniella nasicola]